MAAGPRLGIRLGAVEDLAHGALRPREVRLRARDDRRGLRLGVGQHPVGVRAGRREERVGLGALQLVARLHLGQPGGGLGLGLAAVADGVLLALPAEPVEVGERAGPQGGELGGVGLVLLPPALLVGALLLGEAGHRRLVLGAGAVEEGLGPRLGVGEPGRGLLLGDGDRLVARLGRPGPQQRGLVRRVGEHDLDLGAGLLEPPLGLLARRRQGRLQLVELVRGRLGLAPDARRLGAGLGHLAVGVGAQLVGEELGSREEGQRLIDGAHGRRVARVSRRGHMVRALRHAAHDRRRTSASRTMSATTRPAPGRLCGAHPGQWPRSPHHPKEFRVRTPVHVRVRHRGTPGQDL